MHSASLPCATVMLRVIEYVDPAKGDVTVNDDPVVRQVAVDALGHEKGSVVAVDPTNGRILAIVNQKLAFSAGFEPCSTIKPFVALAGLQEGVITRDTMVRVGNRRYINLTEAMAHSNNKFFEAVGSQLGFDRLIKYHELLGLGQRVGYNIPEEQPGHLPSSPPLFGGAARMSSFGEGIRITPFQLASLVGTLAEGGEQFYLQYPRTDEERQNFQPRVRQQLDIAPLLPDLREGMLAAVMYGTAKRSYDPDGEQDLGKTGTCNDEGVGGASGVVRILRGSGAPENRDRRSASRRQPHYQRATRLANRRPYLSRALRSQLFRRKQFASNYGFAS